uniref:YEATS domain-containing protein n=1 Tax=Biomphalaria glabrata TaxID=6526 RepID=A0A2C9K505_BIOGL
MSSDCVVTVTIELGHQANFLSKPSPEGFTHDWTVFVRGQDGSRLDAFVEKVVFRLHKTFKCPLRTISEPPYKVSESGYAGFLLPIEIHFKNKQSPRKIVFSYDLFLNAKDSPPINNVRIEKLKFQNPTPEFKAKLFKAGGIEQGADPITYPLPDQMPFLIKTELKKSIKAPKDKVKKKKKKNPPKSVSPDVSLSSLSSSSSSLSDNEPSFSLPHPPQKKEKWIHKAGALTYPSTHSKSESSTHIDVDKHKISSKEKYSSESDFSHKPHKHKSKDKDRDKVTHKSKDMSKKVKDSSHKDREGSHSSTKSSGEKKSSSSSSSHKDKERSSSNKEKESATIVHSEKSGSSNKEKERQSSTHKSKHSSHKDLSSSSSSQEKKLKMDTNEVKVSKEKHPSEVKSHKRLHETPQDSSSEKKKLKRSTSVTSVEEKHKTKVEPVKEKHSSKHKESKEHDYLKMKGEKDHKSSTSKKSKHESSQHSDKHKQTSSETKHKEKKEKSSHTKHHDSKYKPDKLDTNTKDNLAMNADFQPKLLISPLKDKSSDEGCQGRSPLMVTEQTKSKRSKSTSSHSSQSSVHDLDKSDTEAQQQADKAKNIISGLADSDSDSGEDSVNPPKTPPKEQKISQPKLLQPVSESSKQSNAKLIEKKRLGELDNTVQESVKTSSKENKINKLDSVSKTDIKKVKEKVTETKMSDKPLEKTSTKDCDILAPNGFLLTELISINEKIEKAHTESNKDLLCRVVDIIGNTDDFDLDENSVFFDICSVDKSIVLQIQAALKEY